MRTACWITKAAHTHTHTHIHTHIHTYTHRICNTYCFSWSLDSSVGTATRYGLVGLGIEFRLGGGVRFSAPVQTGPGAHPASYTMGTGSFLGVNRPGRGIDHPPPFSAEVKERVELYHYSSFGPSWPVLWWTLPLLLPLSLFHDKKGNLNAPRFLFTRMFVNVDRMWKELTLQRGGI